MDLAFIILALLTLAGAIGAVALRNLVHCVLCLTVAFTGVAGLFLQLGAEFIGFAQILVYVGAVAILVVFAILLTRKPGAVEKRPVKATWLGGLAVTLLVGGSIVFTVANSAGLARPRPDAPPPKASVKQMGDLLMSRYVLPLEAIGLVLTAALLGAAVIALKEEESE